MPLIMSNESTSFFILIFFFSISSAFPVSQNLTHHYHPPELSSTLDNTHSMFSTIKTSLARVIGISLYQQNSTFDNSLQHHLDTDQPPDENSEPDPLPLHEDPLHHDTSHQTPTDQHLSHEDLLHMVKMWSKMFQAIELALDNNNNNNNNTSFTIPQSVHLHDENEIEIPQYNIPSTPSHITEKSIHDPEKMPREIIPDVRVALAQAAQLNKKREIERQQKLAQLDDEQDDEDIDYTEGLPRSAPSYPTRVRLQMAAQQHRWTRAR